MLTFEAPRPFDVARLFAECLEQDCVLCGVGGPALLCRECESGLPTAGACGVGPSVDDALAAFDYAFPVDHLVRRFKFAGDLAIGRWLAGALAERVGRAARPDLVVAPPSTRERLRERGFNPALEIAKVVARAIDAPCAIAGLDRARETAPQPGLGRRERERNLEGAMRCRLALEGLHVVLVDDVLTTGATANEAAKVLKQQGAARVSAWVVARTPAGVAPSGTGSNIHV